MRWCLAYHPEQIYTDRRTGLSRLAMTPMHFSEDCIPTAKAQGWVILGTDSDIIESFDANAQNMQTNPKRTVDKDEGTYRDWGEQ
jgi:hypothetical protein